MDSEMHVAEQEPTLRDYLGILRRRGTVIAAAALIAAGGALGVSTRPGSVLAFFPGAGGTGQTYVDTLAEIVQSRAVAERAARVLGYTGADVMEEALEIQASARVAA